MRYPTLVPNLNVLRLTLQGSMTLLSSCHVITLYGRESSRQTAKLRILSVLLKYMRRFFSQVSSRAKKGGRCASLKRVYQHFKETGRLPPANGRFTQRKRAGFYFWHFSETAESRQNRIRFQFSRSVQALYA